MILTIHQPNFMPWYPFFQKMEMADTFVVMGHCQFEKNGYQNRFNINDRWHTMSVFKGLDDIVDKRYANHKRDWTKLKKSLYQYSSILDNFDDIIEKNEGNLFETNYEIIVKLRDMLGINTEIVKDFPSNLTSSDRLAEICSYYGATHYISGMSGKKYLNIDPFEQSKITISFQESSTMIKKHTLEILNDR
jgi:hypothetical protein